MMMNRLQRLLPERGPPNAPDYYVVRSTHLTLLVGRAEAQAVMQQLRRAIRPRWIRVLDLSGSEIMLPARSIEYVLESTAAQRAYDRVLRRVLDEELNGETPAGS